jgi:hypothetical protein
MRGDDVGAWTTLLDDLFLAGPWRTIAIGDGGNEIGMGALPPGLIAAHIAHGDAIACVTPAEHLILAGVSHWGAYALLGGLAAFRADRCATVRRSMASPEPRPSRSTPSTVPRITAYWARSAIWLNQYIDPLNSFYNVTKKARECAAAYVRAKTSGSRDWPSGTMADTSPGGYDGQTKFAATDTVSVVSSPTTAHALSTTDGGGCGGGGGRIKDASIPSIQSSGHSVRRIRGLAAISAIISGSPRRYCNWEPNCAAPKRRAKLGTAPHSHPNRHGNSCHTGFGVSGSLATSGSTSAAD